MSYFKKLSNLELDFDIRHFLKKLWPDIEMPYRPVTFTFDGTLTITELEDEKEVKVAMPANSDEDNRWSSIIDRMNYIQEYVATVERDVWNIYEEMLREKR